MAKDDTIELTLSAEETVVNDTVKIVANISGMVTRDRTETNLREAIRQMMERFISAKWQFASLTRTAHDSGLEQISLIASARVPESENRALDKRRLEASNADEGLSISRVGSDTSFPASLIDATEQKLRLEIIRKARAEGDALSKAMERVYRIKIVRFDMQDMAYNVSNSRMSPSQASAKTSYGSSFSSDVAGSGDAIGNAQKLTMNASIVYATTLSQPVN